MNKESLLKKEFKQSDVQRVRNIVNKDFTASTKHQTGYQKVRKKYKEGDTWEESGKMWTIKNGIKQNITKLDKAKKAIRVPLCCPKCGGSMKHHLSKKMYKIHGFCFDCTVEMEGKLQIAGLYEEYEKNMLKGNLKAFGEDMQSYILDELNKESTYVTEDGVVEDWKGMSKEYKEKVLNELNNYMSILQSHLE